MVKVLSIILGVVTLCLVISIFICVMIGIGAKNLNHDLLAKTRSQKGSIVLRDNILRSIKMNTKGRGNMDKIKEDIEEWDDLKRYENKGIEPTGGINAKNMDNSKDVVL